MKWFDQWFAKKCKQAMGIEEDSLSGDQYVNMPSTKSQRNLVRARHDTELPDGGLNIQVKSAHGGKIVIFRTYDERNDRNLFTIYLIHDSENFEQSLGKIITMESLKL